MNFLNVNLVLVLVVLTNVCGGQEPLSPTSNNNEWFDETIGEFLRNAQNNEETADIQVSTCKISNKQLVATAQATAARMLRGVCNPNEMSQKFADVESHVSHLLSTLSSSLTQKLLELEVEMKRNHRRVMTMMASLKKLEGKAGGSRVVIDDSDSYIPAYIPSVPHSHSHPVEEKVEEKAGESSSDSNPRNDEITKYNSTVHIENGRRIFSYYWRVQGMERKLGDDRRALLRSNSFYIFPRGYRMYLKLRFGTSTMYIHVGLTKGEGDEGLEWPFPLKMRVQVLDQNQNEGTGSRRASSGGVDLKSRIWDPKELCSATNWQKPLVADNDECVGLGFPHDVIQTPQYIWNDGIVVKLTVYLD